MLHRLLFITGCSLALLCAEEGHKEAGIVALGLVLRRDRQLHIASRPGSAMALGASARVAVRLLSASRKAWLGGSSPARRRPPRRSPEWRRLQTRGLGHAAPKLRRVSGLCRRPRPHVPGEYPGVRKEAGTSRALQHEHLRSSSVSRRMMTVAAGLAGVVMGGVYPIIAAGRRPNLMSDADQRPTSSKASVAAATTRAGGRCWDPCGR